MLLLGDEMQALPSRPRPPPDPAAGAGPLVPVQLDIMKDVSHATCGSGGCWASGPHTYTQKPAALFLGTYTPPEQMTVAQLLVMEPGTLQEALQGINLFVALAQPPGKATICPWGLEAGEQAMGGGERGAGRGGAAGARCGKPAQRCFADACLATMVAQTCLAWECGRATWPSS